MNLLEIQEALRDRKLDGWLFFDHHIRDPLAYRVLGFHPTQHVSRRWYYFIPAHGEPAKLVHRIESRVLDSLPGVTNVYSSWTEQTSRLSTLLSGARRVAMQYSPMCAIPYVSLVDAGTVELVRSVGVEVCSSAELVQYFEARIDAAGLESHLEAGRRVDETRRLFFNWVGDRLRAGDRITEFEGAEYVRARFAEFGLITDSGPIVAVNEHAADPHYEPSRELSHPITAGDFVLLDLWAKLDQPDSIFYDITWTGICAASVPSEIQKVFDVVAGGRDAAIAKVQSSGSGLRGFEVDDAARDFIRAAGYADNFVHRTGHSIGREVHGNSANMDNLETHDERLIIPWTCFSIEPGVYLEHFGIRSEVNMFIDDKSARVTGEIQRSVVELLVG